jgi:hypothetical protein
VTLATWSAAVDRLVTACPEIGMDLARARVAVVQYVDGADVVPYLQVKADAPTVAELRANRRAVEAFVLQALLAFGVALECVAFVEEWVR